MNHRPIRNCRGTCLAEVLIALAAGAVVLSATLQSLSHFEKQLSAQHRTVAQTQDVRIGLTIVADELRLAGTASPPTGAPVLAAGRQDIAFVANLGGLVTTLTESVPAGRQELPVVNGTDWPKGKRVIVCDREHCVESRLARDGRRRVLNLTEPLGRDATVGSDVRVVNQVRYYLGADRTGKTSVMRDVDGGANPLIGNVERFEFTYFDRDGRPTHDPLRVTRVRIEAAVGESRTTTVRDVGLRGR